MIEYLFLRTVPVAHFRRVVDSIGLQGLSAAYISSYPVPNNHLQYIPYTFAKNYTSAETPQSFFDEVNALIVKNLVVTLNSDSILPKNIAEFCKQFRYENLIIIDKQLNKVLINYPDCDSYFDNMIRRHYPIELEQLPQKLSLVLSSYCNLSCRMCLNSEMEDLRFMDYSKALQLIDIFGKQISELLLCNYGEAFIHPHINEFFQNIIDNYPHIKISFNTNGIKILNENVMRQLLERDMLASVQFSINSAKAHTYRLINGRDCFDQVISNAMIYGNLLREYQKSSAQLIFSYVAQKDNLVELPNLVDIAKSVGFKQIIVRHVTMKMWQGVTKNKNFISKYKPLIEQSLYLNQSLSDIIFRDLEDKGKSSGISIYIPGYFGEKKQFNTNTDCTQPWDIIEIHANGDVRPCCAYISVGNCFEGDIINIINNDLMKDLRRTVNTPLRNPICRDCWYFNEYGYDHPNYHFDAELCRYFEIK